MNSPRQSEDRTRMFSRVLGPYLVIVTITALARLADVSLDSRLRVKLGVALGIRRVHPAGWARNRCHAPELAGRRGNHCVIGWLVDRAEGNRSSVVSGALPFCWRSGNRQRRLVVACGHDDFGVGRAVPDLRRLGPGAARLDGDDGQPNRRSATRGLDGILPHGCDGAGPDVRTSWRGVGCDTHFDGEVLHATGITEIPTSIQWLP